ncbi:GNAT family N-acetyltransferase [Methanoculleus sp. Wushi-C6]|uniref:GNAT family N-acetyltransferase n=1 Tax=Methanoculleus caldifontis TaxID=2651577 RepID=A0ABU3X0U7_9EURY|nr:GNAT family N-acetyltransferase [Methanoculleus sp. Wushi-C6]MDV2481665.1 GNAT family N-acetyltransferase [Methanoculleus sp. Wushi-C6]
MDRTEVRVLDIDEYPAWDALVATSPQGTVFHTSGWLVRTAGSLNQALAILGCYEDDTLIGGCPLLLSNPYKMLRMAMSAALLAPYGGVVTAGTESTKQRERELHTDRVVAAIRDHIIGERFDHVNLVNSPGLGDIRGFTRNGWEAKVYYTYVLPVNSGVFERISKNARRSIRKAEKLGIVAAEHFDPEGYWTLTENTFSKQNSQPPFSRQHLMSLLEIVREKDLGEMWVARTPSDEIAAAEIIVRDEKAVHRWSAASAEEHLNTGAASLLLGEIAASCADRNCSSLNLMAGNRAHLSTFIASFNPDLVPYYGVERCGIRFRLLRGIKGIAGGMGSRTA